MSIKESVTLDEAIAILNRALDEDRVAISELMLDHKVECNGALADDKTIQVGKRLKLGEHVSTVGVLGILNGLFGIDDDMYDTHYGAIGAQVDKDDGTIQLFSRVDHEKVRDWLDDQEKKNGQE
jgi:hypothetical protein